RALLLAPKRKRSGSAEHGVAKGNLDRARAVLAPFGPGLGPPGAAEEVAEDVPQIPTLERIGLEGVRAREPPRLPRKPTRRGVRTGRGPGVPETVVGPPFLRILQNVIGFLGLLELLLGVFVARIDVGMELPGEPPVRFFYFSFRSPFGDPQDLVIVPFFHEF